jgi:hypothetical protein
MKKAFFLFLLWASCASAGEVLYNGIELPEAWPPKEGATDHQPMQVPYLKNPPAVIPIDLGRQLFVDDFLVKETTLKRTFHQPECCAKNPVMKPDKPWESEGKYPTAMPFSDGVWYDPHDELFKMWYMGGFQESTCYATSHDGISWEKPSLDVKPGTNIVLEENYTPKKRDSTVTWLDLDEKDPAKRFKMFLVRKWPNQPQKNWTGFLYASSDGVHWGEPIAATGPLGGDRSTIFYNPFRKVWVFNKRAQIPGDPRWRRYCEVSDIFADAPKAVEGSSSAILWIGADTNDPPRKGLDNQPELYNLDAVAYESLMLGMFTIWPGQPTDREKPNYLCVGFSRDGFHWDRPDHRPFINISEKYGDWNWANVQSAGGCCLVVGDKLYFYYSARAGVEGKAEAGVCSTGLAVLRRDGFASMDAADTEGALTTRPIRFDGKHLFVNVDAKQGELKADVLDEEGRVIAPFSADQCVAVQNTDSTLQQVCWGTPGNAADLSVLQGKPVSFRFHLKNGRLYSFWVSAEESGASHGYVAAGGPGFTASSDTVGAKAYSVVEKIEHVNP